jgi:DNA-binding NtrC family response regulator
MWRDADRQSCLTVERPILSPVARGTILVIADKAKPMTTLCESLAKEGFATRMVPDLADALVTLREGKFDVLLTDQIEAESNDIQLLRQALEIDSNLVVVMMTEQKMVQATVEVMKATGASDYLLKPLRLQELLSVLHRAIRVRRLKEDDGWHRRNMGGLSFESAHYQIVGTSSVMRKVFQKVEKVAGTEAVVLIQGESGTGKELVARALHTNSPRRNKPLVVINCATLQENLLESELFGYEKGAFTGADRCKPGLLETADEGTLFIDEVAEMVPSLQAKLLRVLEDGHYRRVGSIQERRANVRIVAATNKLLEEEVRQNRFREDLFFRLNVITIVLPDLRERREDIPLLVEHFLRTRKIRSRSHTVTPAAMEMLINYDWPGNIRELANVLERAQILSEGHLITIDDLQLTSSITTKTVSRPVSTALDTVGPRSLRENEKYHVESTLTLMNGNKLKTAKALGVSRGMLYRLIEKHGLVAE